MNFRYANVDFFQNTTYSNTISGKRHSIQTCFSSAFYLPLKIPEWPFTPTPLFIVTNVLLPNDFSISPSTELH